MSVRQAGDTVVVCDAGTGIRRLGREIGPEVRRVDVLLSHLHMDHIQGLGFFDPLYRPGLEVHVWGPSSTTFDLRKRLVRYLSPPLFPVRLRDLPCALSVHDVPLGRFAVPGFEVTTALVCHPAPTVGYRLTGDDGTFTYLSDHEPALATRRDRWDPEWTFGFGLAEGADVLVHDAQYSEAEYPGRVGWGHSSVGDAVRFAAVTGARSSCCSTTTHDDRTLDGLFAVEARADGAQVELVPGREGTTITLGT